MISLMNLGAIILAAYVAYLSFVKWVNEARFMKAARENGCQPIVQIPVLDPILGLDLFWKIRKADFDGRCSETYRALHHKYGATFLMKTLGTFKLQTSQPENIQAICTSRFNDFGVGPMRGDIGLPFLGRGVMTEDGDHWRHSRSLIRPTFNKAEIADLPNFERHVARFLALIPSDDAFDLLPLIKNLFLDTSTEFIFGESTECLNSETPFETNEFTAALNRSLLGVALLIIFGSFRWPLYLDPYWKKAYTKVHAFVDRRVEHALAQRDKKESSEPQKYIVLEEMAKQIQNPYDLRNEILNIFFPARDTAAIGFGNVIFELARHPQEWEKLRAEVLNIHGQPLTFEFVRSLKVVKAIVNETLRLHGPSVRVSRVALKDSILPLGGGSDGKSPIFIPKGQILDMDLHTLHRDPDIWGADANEFKPERWREGRPLWEAKWQYEPFLGGLRMCPAQNQVLIQLSYLLIRFAQEFKSLENKDEVDEFLELTKLSVESKNGVKVAFRRDN